MLQSIRERAQGWIAWAIVILISIPFALWGIQSYFKGGTELPAASVNGSEISQRDFDRQYQNTRIMLREQLGASYDQAMISDPMLRREVLESMIRERLLLATSRAIGLRASDQEIRLAIMANPAFLADGRFDKGAYERALAIQGMTSVQYEEQLRQRLVGSQLQRALFASEFVTELEMVEALRLLRQQREVSYLRIKAADLMTDEPQSEAAILAYYNANQAKFQTPEQVKIEYLLLDEQTIATAAAPSEQELRRLYEVDTSRFGRPERRLLRHILIKLPAENEAGEQQAQDTIATVRGRILAGESFADVAKEVSGDPVSAEKGGLLGEIEPGLMDRAFDTAAFALAEGVVSDPVRTPFGYHLLLVDRVIPASVKPFDEVKDELAIEAGKKQFEALFYDWSERLATLAYEAADSLAPAAQALGLRLQTSDWIARTGGQGLFGSPRVLAAAFSDEVLRQGLNSEVIEPERGVLRATVLRVVDHRESAVRPLDEVREEIIAVLRAQGAQQAAEALAATMVQRLQGGANLTDVAGSWAVSASQTLRRNDPGLPEEVRALAFGLHPPLAGQMAYGSTPLADGDVAVVVLSKVIDGTAADLPDTVRTQETDAMANLVARRVYEEMLSDMVGRAKIERQPVLSSERE